MKQFIVNKIKWLPDKLVEIKMYINLPFIRGGGRQCLELGNNRPVIVSLTSWKPRIKKVAPVLISLMLQTAHIDKIVLWLSQDELSEGDLNIWLKLCMKRGVEVRFMNGLNLRSHKKYFYAMNEYPDSIIITVDDDMIYDKRLVERLIKAHMVYPDAIIANGASKMSFNEKGELLPYSRWIHGSEVKEIEPSYMLFPIGVAGVLYPPHAVHNECFNLEAMMSLCPTHDDLWLKFMGVMNGKKVVLSEGKNFVPGTCIRGTQRHISLGIRNLMNNCAGNDQQMKAILLRYNNYYGKHSLIEIIQNNISVEDFA